jgi:hypothetical protein
MAHQLTASVVGFAVMETSLTSAVPTLERIASEIKNQYEIAYRLPAGTEPSDRLQVTTRRKNVTLRAPENRELMVEASSAPARWSLLRRMEAA